MILYKDKTFMSNSAHPDDDWIGDADFIVADSSDLAQKIIRLYPNFDIVTDNDGSITDIIETEHEVLPEITLEQRVTATENAVEELISMIMGG